VIIGLMAATIRQDPVASMWLHTSPIRRWVTRGDHSDLSWDAQASLWLDLRRTYV
jgi:hypothetical protein